MRGAAGRIAGPGWGERGLLWKAEDRRVVEPLEIVTPLIVAAGASALSTPVVGRIALALGIVDRPDPRKVNLRPNIPLMGGASVAIGCAAGLLAAFLVGDATSDDAWRIAGFFAGGVLLLGLGAWDDRFGLDAKVKLPFQVAAAAIAFAAGFRLDFVTEPFQHHTFELPVWLAFAATILWIVAVTNAMNLMDGLDGLATGLGAIIATTLTVICWESGQTLGVLLGVVLVGAQLGFLPFNFPPGRIFLGDMGAYFIGYAIAVVALSGYRKTALLTFIVPLMALAVPFLDTTLSVLRRLRGRRRIMGADRLHMHHHLLKASGGSQREVVLSLYFLTACFCIIAVAFRSVSGYWAVALLVAVILLTIRLLRNLGLLSLLDPADAQHGDPPADPHPKAVGDGR
jgi:UDP-GlcNAc:undecaprenyl-phosphate GlcNAc-1-phosphate transferase